MQMTPTPQDAERQSRPPQPGLMAKVRMLTRTTVQFLSAGKAFRQPKLFFIGFNKCGTKTLHHFFLNNGYLSIHSSGWMAKRTGGPTSAQLIKSNVEAGQPILRGLSLFEVFSDMIYVSKTEIIEANQYFRELHQAYPDAYFVFNDRPLEKWIRSRLNHNGGKHGNFIEMFESSLALSADEVVELWKKTYHEQKSAVSQYFAGNPRFIVFDIESDKPEKLTDFLKRDFQLDPAEWVHRGSAEERMERQQKKRARHHGAKN